MINTFERTVSAPSQASYRNCPFPGSKERQQQIFLHFARSNGPLDVLRVARRALYRSCGELVETKELLRQSLAETIEVQHLTIVMSMIV